MDGGGITGRMETADNAITFNKGRACGLYITPSFNSRSTWTKVLFCSVLECAPCVRRL
ncbi:UNVERIFIED_ORG: hypothetical protein FHU00_5080 [Citrobacter freundii]